MYKCVTGSAPDYLCELVSSYTPARRLRSLSQSLAVQPKVASKTYGERSFSFMGPFLWNSLPTWIRTLPNVPSFKKHLKTYLYKQQFNTFNQYELNTLFYFLEALRGRWHFALYKYVTLLLSLLLISRFVMVCVI